MSPPRRREARLRIFVVRCGLPCDPPVGGHSCNGGMIPSFERVVCDYFTLRSAADADLTKKPVKTLSPVVVLLGCAARNITWGPIAVASALLSPGEPSPREARYRHRPETAASFAREIESRDRRRPADIVAHE